MMDRNKLGMILFVVSESIFFALLILAYVFYHRTSGEGAAAAKMLDPMKTGVFSIALLSSSATVWGAERQRRRKSGIGAGWWLLASIVLGAIFLVGQGLEYSHLLRNHVTISRDLFGTTFLHVDRLSWVSRTGRPADVGDTGRAGILRTRTGTDA